MKANKILIISVWMVIFHLVGLIGFLNSEWESLFIALVPYHLLLMLAFLIYSTDDFSNNIKLFALIIYLAGFFIEVIGVNSGLIFGNYTYGEALGIKLWSTPLMIGVNWLVLVYCTGVLLEKLNFQNRFFFATIGALILVAIDFLIEPVAVRFDYWSWAGGQIPLQNYIGWFIFSFLLFLVFKAFEFNKKNTAAITLLLAQIGFFLALNIWAL